MVNISTPMKKPRPTQSFLESGYAASMVITRLIAVPVTV